MSMFNFNRAEPGNYSLHVFMFFEVSLYICLASSCFRDTPFLQKGRQVSLTFLPCLFVLTSVKTARWRSPSSHFSVERLVFSAAPRNCKKDCGFASDACCRLSFLGKVGKVSSRGKPPQTPSVTCKSRATSVFRQCLVLLDREPLD